MDAPICRRRNCTRRPAPRQIVCHVHFILTVANARGYMSEDQAIALVKAGSRAIDWEPDPDDWQAR